MKKFMIMLAVITGIVTFKIFHSEKDFVTNCSSMSANEIWGIHQERDNSIAKALLLSIGMAVIVPLGISGIIRYFKEGK